jgi:hypothetical protein
MKTTALPFPFLHAHRLAACVVGIVLVLAACGGGGGGGAISDGGGSGGSRPAAAWQVAQLLEATDGHADGADVAINASGVGYAVWAQEENDRRKIMSSRYINGQWQRAQEVTKNLNTQQDAQDPQVVVHADGRATAIWVQPHLVGPAVVGSNTADDGTWLPMTVVQSVQGTTPVDLELVADELGGAMAVWRVDSTVLASHIRGNDFEVPPRQISASTSRGAFAPDVAMNTQGDALAVWSEQDEDGVDRVFVRTFVDGGWGAKPAALSSDTATGIVGPQVAMGDDLKAVVTWVQAQGIGIEQDVMARVGRNVAIRLWDPEAVVGTGDAFLASVAMNAPGNAVVAWQEREGTRVNIHAARLDGNAWDERKVETTDVGNASFVDVGMDAGGRAMAVWQQDDGTRINILASRMDPVSGDWGTPVPVENEDRRDAGRATLAVNAFGRAVAVWHQANTAATPPGGEHVTSVLGNVFK